MNTDTRNMWIGAVVLIIIIAAIIFFGKRDVIAPENDNDQGIIPQDWDTFESGSYNSTTDMSTVYNISHPEEFEVIKSDKAKGGYLSNPMITLPFPEDSFVSSDTNFKEAYATVSSSKSKNTEARCFTKPAGSTGEYEDVESGNDEEAENNMITRRIDLTSTASGTETTSRVYRTLFDSVCYEVALTVVTNDIAEGEEGVTEFDREEAFGVLENIRETFKLSKVEGPLK